MWPWEHLAIGYLVVSVATRVGWGRSPGDAVVLATALGTQFPDLVDKPLGWVLGILPGGTNVAHSVFFAVPMVLLVWTLAWRTRWRAMSVGFGAGYLAHLPGDVLYPVLLGSEAKWEMLVWPLAGASAGDTVAVGPYVMELFAAFLRQVGSASGAWYLALELLLVGLALALWIDDGRPGLTVGRRQ
jgi:hypothetical protein